MQKDQQKQYRLLSKSPLKSSPNKNLSPIFRTRNSLNKTKISSPRKLQFILPKVKVARPRHRIPLMQRILKAKPPSESVSDIYHTGNKELMNVDDNVRTPTSLTPEELPIEKNSQRHEEIDENEEDGDDIDLQLQEDHLAAFLKASSTIALQRSGEKKGNSRHKLNKHQRRLQERISALSYIPDWNSHQNALVINYVVKVKDALTSADEGKFNLFITLLEEFACSSNAPEMTYFQICDILKDFPDLREEFVMFLRPDQAVGVGKFTEYSKIVRLIEFADELKHHFTRQPQNLQKFVKTLQILYNKPNITNKEFIDSFTPILRLQPQLLESLNQCLPSEPPQESIADDFEEINLEQPGTPDSMEQISFIEEEVKLPSENCLCSCHLPFSTPPYTNSLTHTQAKSEHCISCKIRFIDGRVYVQCGKALRPAKVTYISAKKGEKEEILSSNNHSSDLSVLSVLKSKEDKSNKKDKNYSDKFSKLGKGISKLLDSSETEKPRKGRKPRKIKIM